MNEADLMRLIQIRVSEFGGRVFRNNIGTAFTADGRAVKYGVQNPGGSDLIGWTKEGQFLAIEVKMPKGKTTKEQEAFINNVNASGGVAFIARAPEDVDFYLTPF